MLGIIGYEHQMLIANSDVLDVAFCLVTPGNSALGYIQPADVVHGNKLPVSRPVEKWATHAG